MSIEAQIRNIDKQIETATWLSDWDKVERLEQKRNELVAIRHKLEGMEI